MNLSPRAQIGIAVLGFVAILGAAVLARKDIVPPLGPQPAPPPARYGLHVWSVRGCQPCVQLHDELRKPEAQAALTRFTVTEEAGGGLAAVSWGLHGYPTMIVTGDADKELGRHEGFMSAAAIVAWLDGFK